MFKKKEKEYHKLLGISEENLLDFSKRLLYFLRSKKDFGKNEIIEGLFILEEIKQKEKDEQEAKKPKLNFGTIKNRYIKKYGYEILQLRKEEGIGAILIEKDLYANHRIKVSKTTIQTFLGLNKEYLENG